MIDILAAGVHKGRAPWRVAAPDGASEGSADAILKYGVVHTRQ